MYITRTVYEVEIAVHGPRIQKILPTPPSPASGWATALPPVAGRVCLCDFLQSTPHHHSLHSRSEEGAGA